MKTHDAGAMGGMRMAQTSVAASVATTEDGQSMGTHSSLGLAPILSQGSPKKENPCSHDSYRMPGCQEVGHLQFSYPWPPIRHT